MQFVSKSRKTIFYSTVLALLLSNCLGYSVAFFAVFNQNVLRFTVSQSAHTMSTMSSGNIDAQATSNVFLTGLFNIFEGKNVKSSLKLLGSKQGNTGYFNVMNISQYLMLAFLFLMLFITKKETLKRVLLESDGKK